MDEENEYVQEDVVEQEEQTSEEVEESNEETYDDAVTLSKEEFTKLKRKAIAYDSNKRKPEVEQQPVQKTDSSDSYLEEVFLVKDLSQTEYESLKNEADDLGVSFKKLLSSESGKTILSKIRQESKSKDSMEKLTSKSPVYKKFTQEDLSKMSSAEMEKVLKE
jgi:hypothetical protein